MTLRIPHNPVLNPRALPWQSWVEGWHVAYHRTEEAAMRRAKREAAAAAKQSGGPAPAGEVRRVVFASHSA